MGKFVVMFNNIDSKSIYDEYETIEGKNYQDALKKRFNKKFKRVTGEADRHADVILQKGYYDKENNTIVRHSRMMVCYALDK